MPKPPSCSPSGAQSVDWRRRGGHAPPQQGRGPSPEDSHQPPRCYPPQCQQVAPLSAWLWAPAPPGQGSQATSRTRTCLPQGLLGLLLGPSLWRKSQGAGVGVCLSCAHLPSPVVSVPTLHTCHCLSWHP